MNNNNIITKRTAKRNPFKRNYPLDGIKKAFKTGHRTSKDKKGAKRQ